MVDEKLIDELSHFHYLPMRSDINIINIYQQLSLKFSNYVPITKKLVDELHDELYDGLKKLDQKDIYYTDKKTIFEDDAIKSFVTKGSYNVISEQGYHEYLYGDDENGIYASDEPINVKLSTLNYTGKSTIWFNAIDAKTKKRIPEKDKQYVFDTNTSFADDLGKFVEDLLLSKEGLIYYLAPDTRTQRKYYSFSNFFEYIIGYDPIGLNASNLYQHGVKSKDIWALYQDNRPAMIMPNTYMETRKYDARIKYLQQNHIDYKEIKDGSPLCQKIAQTENISTPIYTDDDQSQFGFHLTGKLLKLAHAYFVATDLYNHQQGNYKMSSTLFKAAAKLIYVQQQKFNVKVDKAQLDKIFDLDDFNDAMQLFFKRYMLPQENDSLMSTITVLDLAQYMANIIKHQPISDKMLQLIASVGENNDITSNQAKDNKKILIDQARRYNLEDKLVLPDIKERQEALEYLPDDIASHVKNVYIVKQTQDLSSYKHTKMLTHGTPNVSILSILKNGLLDNVTLEKQKNNYFNYTGSGLGTGIYFTRPKQVQKSIYYADYRNKDNMPYYIFLAQVGYNKTVDTDHYTYDDKPVEKGDLLWAHGVGSGDRDELLAPDYHQIKLKYLFEF